MILLPAIDLRGGRCVRLVQGDARRQRVYADDPLAVAREWIRQGARWLHVVDLDGAFAGRPVHLPLLGAIAMLPGGRVQAGGGFRTLADVDAGLATGVARVVLGTAAARLAREAVRRFGDRIAVAIDARGPRLATHGWTAVAPRSALAAARDLAARGIQRFVYTDVARDGTLGGPNLDGVARFVRALSVPVIAAGGVASRDDLAALAATGVEGAILGRALYEGQIALRDVVDGVGRWRDDNSPPRKSPRNAWEPQC